VLTTAEAFRGTDIVVTMLPTSKIVASVLFEWEGGVVPQLRGGATVIDMSSSDPVDTLTTASRAAELGIRFVDAPVSGGVAGAEAGSLTIMAGGEDSDIAAVATVLETLGSRIVHTGPLGSGHAMKSLNNIVAAATTIACLEAMTAGAQFGLDPETMTQVWNSSTASSFVTKSVMTPEVVTRNFNSGYSLPLYAKDVSVAAAMFADKQIAAPVCSAAVGEFQEALTKLGDVDHTRLAELYDFASDDS
jgi:3-hydroxyisobutyrate dehydrogenase